MVFLKPDTREDDYPTTKHLAINPGSIINDMLKVVDRSEQKLEVALTKNETNDLLDYFLSIADNSRSEPRQEQPKVIVSIVVNHAVQPCLTKRELTILQLIANGSTTTEICAQLFLSECTVKREVRNIFSKLDVRNRSQAVAEAYKRSMFKEL